MLSQFWQSKEKSNIVNQNLFRIFECRYFVLNYQSNKLGKTEKVIVPSFFCKYFLFLQIVDKYIIGAHKIMKKYLVSVKPFIATILRQQYWIFSFVPHIVIALPTLLQQLSILSHCFIFLIGFEHWSMASFLY